MPRHVSGTRVGHDIGRGADVWGSLEKWEIADRLVPGANVLGIRTICLGGSRGVVAALRVETDGAEALERITENRAAQVLASVFRDQRYASAVPAAYERYRAKPEETFTRALNHPQTFQVKLPQALGVALPGTGAQILA